MPVRNLRDAVIDISDAGGAGGANTIAVILEEESGISWEESNPVDFIPDRGTLHHARQGNDVPLSGTLNLKFETFQDPNSATETPYEAVTQTGAAAAWVSDASNGGDAYAFQFRMTIADPAGGSSEVITITEVYATSISFAEGSPHNTLRIGFEALMTRPTYA